MNILLTHANAGGIWKNVKQGVKISVFQENNQDVKIERDYHMIYSDKVLYGITGL